MLGLTGGAGDERLDHSRTSTTVSAAEPPPQAIRVRASGESARRRRGGFWELAATSIGYGRRARGARVRARGARVGARGARVGARGARVGARGARVGARGARVGARGAR